MELSSTFRGTWKLFIIGSLLGCFILLLNLTENDQNVSLSTAKNRNNILEFTPQEALNVSSPPPLATRITTTSTLSNFSNPSPPPKAGMVDQPTEVSNKSNIGVSPIGSVADEFTDMSISSPSPTASAVAKPSDFSISTSQPPIGSMIDEFSVTKPSKPSDFSIYTSQPPIATVVVVPPSVVTNYNATEKLVANHNREKQNISYVDDNLGKSKKKCNMFNGRWVYKKDANPAYKLWQCPFIEEKMSCQSNGRPDLEYEKWSWEAHDCNIPLLNGSDMVERFRNKRVVLVGDSLNRNMWESLSCILYSSIPNASSIAKVRSQSAHIKTFLTVKGEYNFTVEFFWSPFLVELNKTHESGKKVLVLDKLSPNSELWPGADIMIFNSGHWWTQAGKKKAWELYEYQGKLIEKMALQVAYKRAMKTWAKWVEKNVDPSKTTLLFRSVSAEHLDRKRDQWCHTKTKPILDESYNPFFPNTLIRAIEDVIKGMNKIQVTYLNVTKLSEYRIDAHPSIYRYKDWKTRSQKDMTGLLSTADCGHWCLPGLPDTWNRLLYASLVFDDSRDEFIS